MLRKTYRLKLPFLFFFPIMGALALGGRLWYLQVLHHDYYLSRAHGQQTVEIPIRPRRGVIMSADGVELAVSMPTYAVYSETRLIKRDHEEIARYLSMILGGSELKYLHQLRSGKVITLRRKADMRIKERLEDLKKQFRMHRYAIRFEEEGKRFYPKGSLAAHVVGYTTIDEFGDNQGLAGLESQFNENLSGSLEKYRASRTGGQTPMNPAPEETYRRAFGDSLVLTLNSAVQHAAEEAVEAQVHEFQAEAGVAVVYEAKTGRVLAMANYPTFDLNDFAQATFDQQRNRAINDVIEPGSVLKILSLGAMMDAGLITPDTVFDCEGGRTRFGRRRVTDSGKKMHLATIRQIFQHSSNVGTNKAALLIAKEQFDYYLRRFGIGERTGIELPGERKGQLEPVGKWSGYSMTSLPIGYELQTNAMQIVRAVGAIANDGIMMRPYIVEEIRDWNWHLKWKRRPERDRRAVGPTAAAQMLSMMESVVLEGTGKKLKLPGYRFGGKTGTTKKHVPGKGYVPRHYISSFCGVVPIEDPEVVIYVYIDMPQGAYYGGTVAGPAFEKIAEEVIRVRAIPPSEQPLDEFEAIWGTPTSSASRFDESQSLYAANRLGSELPTLRSGDETLSEAGPATNVIREVRMGLMPDLTGITMQEAMRILKKMDVGHLAINGTGVVSQQIPEPGAQVSHETAVTLTFTP
jgi:cell division protein FtsI/penicillin-binding protein 2